MSEQLLCPKCGHPRSGEVTDPLASCTNCGLIFSRYKPPVPRTERKRTISFTSILSIVLFVFVASYGAGTALNRSDSKDRGFEPSQATKEASYIELNQDRIKARLKDSGSAQFRNAFVSNAIGSPIVCGEVNGKNSFGGYIGFQRFISGGAIQVLEADMAVGEMDKTWSQVCRR
jgi:hypothetical protein